MCTEVPEILVNGQYLINDVNKAVEDALTGLVRCNPNLALLDIGRVVIVKEHLEFEKVKILSGGASGHEPAFGGFVGPGMLTAAVQGNIFCSPSPDLVLRTIKELARRHENGILIIIGNNMSDRLSFGLAMERASNIPNLKIKMLIVSDDCGNSYERRGLVGTIIMQKIAGAMAEADFPLDEIYSFCSNILPNFSTVLVSVRSCISPFVEISSCAKFLMPKEMEFGSGLHGELGYSKLPLQSSHITVKTILEQITNPNMPGYLALEPTNEIVVFVNNLGNSSRLEEHIILNELIVQLHTMELNIVKIYAGSYITSLEMCGFSVTIIKITDPRIMEYLNADCEAPYWKSYTDFNVNTNPDIWISSVLPPKEKRLKPDRGPRVSDSIANVIQSAIGFACGALISCEKQLNLIDSESGDADTGSNFKRGIIKITEMIGAGKLRMNWPFILFQDLSKILEKNSEGLVCCLYAIMFEAAAKTFFEMEETQNVDAYVWLDCLIRARNAVECYGKSQFGSRTMFDPLHAATEAFKNGLNSDMGALDAFGLAAVTAEETARKTRASKAFHPDPGAHAVGIWMRAVYEALKLQNWPLI